MPEERESEGASLDPLTSTSVPLNSETNVAHHYAAIAVKVPVLKVFDYRIPKELIGSIEVGSRVRVPFGPRRLVGTVTELLETPRHEPVKDILALVSSRPLLPQKLMTLARWMADYYLCSEGDVIEGLVPVSVRGSGVRSFVLEVSLKVERSEALRLAEKSLAKAPQRARVLRTLAESMSPLTLNELTSRAKVSRSPVDTLTKHGVLETRRVSVVDDPLMSVVEDPKPAPELSPHQFEALQEILESQRQISFRGFLLFGVTGSGKTEVYLRAIEAMIERGRQAIVLVPEISLTPQTLARFKGRFKNIAVLHSRLTDAQRAEQWHRIRNGKADVVIGARSALFAPVPKLGLIVVDEEHESSYKQQQAPRYHARDVALMRGHLEGAPVILGSATPSLESWRLAQQDRIRTLRLPSRVGGGELPSTIIVDLEKTLGSGWTSVLSDRLQVALLQTLNRKEQAILFLNRRGFSPTMYCGVCRGPYSCRECSVSLTWHRRSRRLQCHYCGYEELPPTHCPTCKRGRLRHLGFGTERAEEEVRRFLPAARVERMDSDTTVGRGSHEAILGRFVRGDIDILVGTQMIAKGLDFPRVTLVGVLMADSALSLPDFRSAERTFQLVSQVSGRAGRSELGGLVVVQSFNPHHIAIQSALSHDFESFAESEMAAREGASYPPFAFLARLVWSGKKVEAVMEAAHLVKTKIDPMAREHGVSILGPVIAPIEKIAGRFRVHAILKAQTRPALRRILAILRELPPPKKNVRLSIDVDPVQTL